MKVGERFNPYRIFVGLWIPDCLAEYDALAPTAKLIWGRLAQKAGKRGAAEISYRKLAASVGIQRRRCIDLCNALEAEGFVRRRPDPENRCNPPTFEFLWHPIFEAARHRQADGAAECTSAEHCTSAEECTSAETCTSTSAENCTRDSAENCTPPGGPPPLGSSLGTIGSQTDAAGADAVGCPWCRKPSKQTSGTHHLLQKFHDLYRAEFHICPTPTPGRDAKLLKQLLSAGNTEADILEVLALYFRTKDEWFNSHGYDVPTFRGAFDRLRLQARKEASVGAGDDDAI